MVEDQDDQEMTVKLIDFGFGSRILGEVESQGGYLCVPWRAFGNERPQDTQMGRREPTYLEDHPI